MDLSRIAKWVAALVVVLVVWKYVVPWAKEQVRGGSSSSSSASGPGGNCIGSVDRAANAWGNGLGRFVNPPYDNDAWMSFKNDVSSRISTAESDCSCSEESCLKSREAMRDLRVLMQEFDSTIRNGLPPPEDAVRRQEQIDNTIDAARDLLKSGK